MIRINRRNASAYIGQNVRIGERDGNTFDATLLAWGPQVIRVRVNGAFRELSTVTVIGVYRVPAIAVEVDSTRKTHTRGSYTAISDGRGRYQIALNGFEEGSILFAGGFWIATLGGKSEKRRTVVEAFEAVLAK